MMECRLVALVVCLICCAACGNGDLPPAPDTGTFRPEGPTPRLDAGGGGEEDGSDSEPDLSACGDDACAPGALRCMAAGVQTCELDGTSSCGVWGSIVDCDQPGEACVDGTCMVPTECVDNDGDGFGVQCAAGADCNDADETVFPGAPEICDGVDNNCDQTIDEGFQIGDACTTGAGDCMASGVNACAADGTVTCNVSEPAGSPETCDGIDNDCDGVIDNGACAVCSGDIYEPNDSLAEAEPVLPGTPLIGLLCPSDSDFVSLSMQPDTLYRLNIAFPEGLADLDVIPYVDGVAQPTVNSSGYDWERFNVDSSIASDVAVQISNPANAETIFRVGLVELSQLRCDDEDGFAPNQRIQDSFPLLRGWEPYVYMCPSNGGANNRVSDWYRLGEIMQGQQITVESLEDEGIFSNDYDLDLYLWSDPDGDNTYTVEKQEDTFDDAELLIHTAGHTGPRYLEVRDYGGDGGNYWVSWDVN